MNVHHILVRMEELVSTVKTALFVIVLKVIMMTCVLATLMNVQVNRVSVEHVEMVSTLTSVTVNLVLRATTVIGK